MEKTDKRRIALSGTSFLAFGAGGLTMYFLDPDQGRSRRAVIQDKIAAGFRRSSDRAQKRGRYLAGQVEGAKERITRSGAEESVPPNDQALLAKIESEVTGGAQFPKERISINVDNGVVFLRGELDSIEQIDEIEQAVRKVTGVIDVRNLLHLPGESPPNLRPVQNTEAQQQ
jgi:osmotically-inducible protein OsmY